MRIVVKTNTTSLKTQNISRTLTHEVCMKKECTIEKKRKMNVCVSTHNYDGTVRTAERKEKEIEE